MATPVTTACATHPKREGVASCGSCGKAVCRDCVVHTGVGIKCRTCTGEKAPAGASRARPRWLVPAAVGGAVVLLAAVLALRGGGGSSTGEGVGTADAAGSRFPIERKIELTGGGGTRIGATLTLPAEGRTPVAAALIVPGFGAIDRDAAMGIANTPDRSADRLSQDQNYSRPGSPDNLFKDFSGALVALDVATLRYDKRGGAASPLKDDQPLSYDDLVADAKAGLDFLSQRRETATAPLVILGADQGGLIALRLAGTPRLKAVALVSTFGRPLADVIAGDLTRRGERGQQEAEQLKDVAAKLIAGQPLPAPDQLLGNLRAVLRPLQEKYLRAVFALDPVAEAQAVRVPALVVRGAADTTTTAADTERLLTALPAGTEEVVFPDGDHNLGTNGRRDADLVAQVARWLVARAAA